MNNEMQAALILYTVRQKCSSIAELADALERISKIGYKAVQFSALPGIEPEAVRELFDKNSLQCCGSHESLPDLTGNIDAVIKRLKILGCSYAAIAHPGGDFPHTLKPDKLASVLNGIAKRLKDSGIRFGYHNHAVEFEKIGGKTMLDYLYDNTDPELVFAEIDTFWIQHGGQNPAAWIRKLKNRVYAVHFKDFAVKGNSIKNAEVGEGNLDWDDIIRACRESNVRWCVVEQDNPTEGRDIFESVSMSYDYLKKMNVK